MQAWANSCVCSQYSFQDQPLKVPGAPGTSCLNAIEAPSLSTHCLKRDMIVRGSWAATPFLASTGTHSPVLSVVRGARTPGSVSGSAVGRPLLRRAPPETTMSSPIAATAAPTVTASLVWKSSADGSSGSMERTESIAGWVGGEEGRRGGGRCTKDRWSSKDIFQYCRKHPRAALTAQAQAHRRAAAERWY